MAFSVGFFFCWIFWKQTIKQEFHSMDLNGSNTLRHKKTEDTKYNMSSHITCVHLIMQ